MYAFFNIIALVESLLCLLSNIKWVLVSYQCRPLLLSLRSIHFYIFVEKLGNISHSVAFGVSRVLIGPTLMFCYLH